jgi:hypothetical protein
VKHYAPPIKMANTIHIVYTVYGILAVMLVLLLLTSLVLQLCALQCHNLSQRLFPALDQNGYEYWMDWGTLLGARREGRMIAHDYDADIGMRESEFQRLHADWKSNPAKFKGMRLYKEDKKLARVRCGLGWVDVFRYDDSDPSVLRMISMDDESHSCKCKGAGHTVSPSLIFPLKSLTFGGVSGKAPARTDEYLEHLYGSDWKTPRTNGGAKLVKLVPLPRRV